MLFENEVLRDYKLTPQEIAMGKGMAINIWVVLCQYSTVRIIVIVVNMWCNVMPKLLYISL